MKALTMAMAAMIGLTACNRESKREGDAAAREAAEAADDSREAARQAEAGAVRTEDAASREARQTGNDIREGAGQLTDKTKEEARQTNRDIREAADKVGTPDGPAGRDVHARDVSEGADKATEGARQSTRDAKDGAGDLTDKTREEARQTNRDIKEAVGMDEGKTAADKQLIARIRTALKADKDVAAEARDVRIEAENGEVDLEGTVTSKEIKDGIVRITRKIAGATKVDDEMKVADRVGAGASDR